MSLTYLIAYRHDKMNREFSLGSMGPVDIYCTAVLTSLLDCKLHNIFIFGMAYYSKFRSDVMSLSAKL